MFPLDLPQVKRNLRAAYHADASGAVSSNWQMDLMVKIRAIGPLSGVKKPGAMFQILVWRLAPAMALTLAILISGMLAMDTSFLQESFINDPMAVIYNNIFWG